MDATEAAAWLATVSLGATLYAFAELALPGLSWRRSRSGQIEPGPVPGYTFYPGEALDEHRMGLDASPWRAHCLETFHSPKRQRAVVTLAARSGAGQMPTSEVPGQLLGVARRVQQATKVDVVVVEWTPNPDAPSALGSWVGVYSPDALAWGGEREVVRFFAEGPAEPQQQGSDDASTPR